MYAWTLASSQLQSHLEHIGKHNQMLCSLYQFSFFVKKKKKSIENKIQIVSKVLLEYGAESVFSASGTSVSLLRY